MTEAPTPQPPALASGPNTKEGEFSPLMSGHGRPFYLPTVIPSHEPGQLQTQLIPCTKLPVSSFPNGWFHLSFLIET